MAAATEFLRLKLVEPVLRLAEAEKIAGALAQETQRKSEPTKLLDTSAAVRLSFVDTFGDRASELERSEAAGSTTSAEELAKLLTQLSFEGS